MGYGGSGKSTARLLSADYAASRDATDAFWKPDAPPLNIDMISRECYDNGYTCSGNDSESSADMPTTLRHADYDGTWACYAKFNEIFVDEVSTYIADGMSVAHSASISTSVTLPTLDTTDSIHDGFTSMLSRHPSSWSDEAAIHGEVRHIDVMKFHNVGVDSSVCHNKYDSTVSAVRYDGRRATCRGVVTSGEADAEVVNPAGYFMIVPPCDPIDEASSNSVCGKPFVEARSSERSHGGVPAEPTDKNATDKYRLTLAPRRPPPIFKTKGQWRRYLRDLKVKERNRLEAEEKAAAAAEPYALEMAKLTGPSTYS
eukprot:GEMP01011681.1.p1 GENE.GEMP01011681.1~~GEMP01011681.1.p1  ORF type:complete len:314 (-),score=64.09 GEMP01011681.1:2210-3151(-)